jgi:hypothetical protein
MKVPGAKAVAIINHPDVRRDLLWMKSRIEGHRALLYYTSFCLDMAESTEDREEHKKWLGMAELLIPVCKAYVTDNSMTVCSKAMDVYGGYGYCAEYPVEQYLRDCKITTIYEGTNGIQCLDLVGRKLGSAKGANVMNLAGQIMGIIGKAKKFDEFKAIAKYLEEAGNALVDLTMTFGGWGKGGTFMLPILNASPFMDIFGDVVVSYFLLEAGVIAKEKLDAIYEENGAETIGKKRALLRKNADVAFYTGKVASAKFFALDTLPTVKSRCEAIKLGDKTCIELPDECFAM